MEKKVRVILEKTSKKEEPGLRRVFRNKTILVIGIRTNRYKLFKALRTPQATKSIFLSSNNSKLTRIISCVYIFFIKL